MDVWTALHDGDHRLARQVAARRPRGARRLASVVREAAEHTRLWWAAAAVLASAGGWRGRRAAMAGVLAMAAAETVSNALVKPLCPRGRPSGEWVPAEEARERPDSSSFPSGHTAAAVAFTGAVTAVWPWAGAVCAAPAALVAWERVHSGAHYPSDVAAGAAIGAGAAVLVHRAPRIARGLL